MYPFMWKKMDSLNVPFEIWMCVKTKGDSRTISAQLGGHFIMTLWHLLTSHYSDVIMSTVASQITSLTIVYSTVHSGTDQRKHQSSASLAFGPGIHRWQVNSPHKWPVTWKMFPFDDVIMYKNLKCPHITWCLLFPVTCIYINWLWYT